MEMELAHSTLVCCTPAREADRGPACGMPFIPHNDYLRMLAEYGLINLVVFVCFMLHVLRNLRTGQTKVLFMVLLFYFFTENLFDHFPSMTLYFTFAGRFAAMSATARVARR